MQKLFSTLPDQETASWLFLRSSSAYCRPPGPVIFSAARLDMWMCRQVGNFSESIRGPMLFKGYYEGLNSLQNELEI